MSLIKHIWIATHTKDRSEAGKHAGTNSRIGWLINEDGIDKLHIDLPRRIRQVSTTGKVVAGQQLGESTVHDFDVESLNIDSDGITNSSIRLELRGEDLWRPRAALVWAEVESSRGSDATRVLPLAGYPPSFLDLDTTLSTDPDEGTVSMPLPRLQLADADDELRRFHVLATTLDEENAGTDDDVELTLAFSGEVPDVKRPLRGVFGRGEADFLISEIAVVVPGEPIKTKSTLNHAVVRISGPDSWSPGSFFVFGEGAGRIIPLIHVPRWFSGPLSTDSTEGHDAVILGPGTIPA